MSERISPMPTTPRNMKPPPRRISGSLTIAPEILAMKKTQEEVKQKLNRIVEKVKSDSDRPKE